MRDADHSLTHRLVQDLSLELADHARVLTEFSARLASSREQLIQAWRTPNRARGEGATANVQAAEDAARVLIEALWFSTDSTLRHYLEGVAKWAEAQALAGQDFADLVAQYKNYRRALLPLIVRYYSSGPELELLFSALDALERATESIFASVAIELAHLQLAQGARARAVGRLTGGIAHSLNNALAGIIGRAQLLEKTQRDAATLGELRAIQTAARNAAENLRRVQEYAAARADDTAVPLDVNVIAQQAIQLTRFRWRDDAEANGIVIDVVRDTATVPQVIGNPAALRDALIELILNAVEAMPLGGLVTVRTERVGEQVQVSVTDMGEGMDGATQARLFQPFFTTKGQGHVGLGLASANAIASQHHGNLQIETLVGRGTTATITLPIATIQSVPEAEQTPTALPGTNILIVDDDPALREIAAKSLRLRGHHTTAVESGSDALRTFRDPGPFDVVLTDLGMPEMNGFQVAQAIKQFEPKTIVILMTGWAAELDPRKIRESGIDRAITKPFNVDQVMQLVNEAMAIREKM